MACLHWTSVHKNGAQIVFLRHLVSYSVNKQKSKDCENNSNAIDDKITILTERHIGSKRKPMKNDMII